jgi:hypothetical protein
MEVVEQAKGKTTRAPIQLGREHNGDEGLIAKGRKSDRGWLDRCRMCYICVAGETARSLVTVTRFGEQVSGSIKED